MGWLLTMVTTVILSRQLFCFNLGKAQFYWQVGIYLK